MGLDAEPLLLILALETWSWQWERHFLLLQMVNECLLESPEEKHEDD